MSDNDDEESRSGRGTEEYTRCRLVMAIHQESRIYASKTDRQKPYAMWKETLCDIREGCDNLYEHVAIRKTRNEERYTEPQITKESEDLNLS